MNLTQIDDVKRRAAELKRFYFTGLTGFEPVVHINHYGANGKGQIRANQRLMDPTVIGGDWVLREFELQKTASSWQIVPATLDVNPFSQYFAADQMIADQAAFTNALASAVPTLAVNDVNTFNWTPADTFAAANGHTDSADDNYSTWFDDAGPGNPVRLAIANKLVSIGNSLTPDNIVARAQMLACQGCHALTNPNDLGGGLVLPTRTLEFTHVSEQTEQGPDGARHLISSWLTDMFLPHRAAVLSSFLPACTKTCAQLGAQCGTVSDGCTGTLDCGVCADGLSCVSNKCIQCAPQACLQMESTCGVTSDGCGGTIFCGMCPAGLRCLNGTCN
jgi:hypothetical protein